MSQREPATRSARSVGQLGRRVGGAIGRRVTEQLGGPERTRVITVLAAVGALASADAATVGASASQLRAALHIDNTDIGLLVALSALVGAAASIPFGVLADRASRTKVLAPAVALWGVAMLWSATAGSFGRLLEARLALGVVMAAGGPAVASLVGDYFVPDERGRIYSVISVGELAGAGLGFAVTGDIAALSWRAAFVVLALPAFAIAWLVFRLEEPARGGQDALLPPERHAGTTRPLPAQPPGTEPAPEGAPPGTEPAPEGTPVQELALARQLTPDARLVAMDRRGFVNAIRYILRVRTNILLIVSGACGYYFLAGIQTFGVEFVKGHFSINQALANLLMIVIGGGAVVGVLIGGPLGDHLLRRGRLNGRVLVAAVASAVTALLFVPALATRSVVTALPYVVLASAALSAQNPAIDAARLDIMPAALWGRAEGVRTTVRTAAQAMAPLLFGAVSDLLGGGTQGLQWTFVIMLAPLGASAVFLFRALRTYPTDVATAAAVTYGDGITAGAQGTGRTAGR